MKKFFSLLLLATASFHGHAQKTLSRDYSYTVSEPYKVFDAKKKFYFSRANEAMAVKFDGDEVLIQKFDSEKPAFIKEIPYEKRFPKNYEVENVVEVNNRHYMFYSSWDGNAKKEQLFLQEIDFAAGAFKGDPKLLFQIDGKVTRNIPNDPSRSQWGYSFNPGGNKFELHRSQDKKHLLVEYRKRPEVKNDKKSFDIIGLGSYDENMEKIALNELTMPYTERRMDNLDYKLNNNGDLFLLTKVFHDDSNEDKKKRKDSLANYHIELFVVKSGSSKIDISRFDNNDKFVNGLWVFDTNKDYLVCGGFYSNGKGKTRGKSDGWNSSKYSYTGESDGIMVFKIKPDGTIYDTYYHEIPLEILNAYESSRTARKNEKKEEKGISAKIADLMLKNIEVLDDGSMMLIGEQYYRKYNQNYGVGVGFGNGNVGFGNNVGPTGFGSAGFNTTGYGMYEINYSSYYEDILATKITTDGGLAYMRKIPKKQVGKKGQGGMSYKYFFANHNHYIIYLDNVKNIDLPENETPATHSDGAGGYLTSVKIDDATGTLTKGSILNAREVEDFKISQFNTGRIVKTSENSFLLEAYKKQKEDVMIKITLNH